MLKKRAFVFSAVYQISFWLRIQEALKKQIPKKPKNKNKVNDGYYWEWVCPNCEVIQIGTEKPYCPECGQSICW